MGSKAVIFILFYEGEVGMNNLEKDEVRLERKKEKERAKLEAADYSNFSYNFSSY